MNGLDVGRCRSSRSPSFILWSVPLGIRNECSKKPGHNTIHNPRNGNLNWCSAYIYHRAQLVFVDLVYSFREFLECIRFWPSLEKPPAIRAVFIIATRNQTGLIAHPLASFWRRYHVRSDMPAAIHGLSGVWPIRGRPRLIFGEPVG